ncbi:MAG: serine protease, partial [Campylobacterota bacterium]|nr:serine protease [Campylobacterota bacterium]
MNHLLQLKGTFEQASRSQDGFGAPNLPAGQSVNVSKLEGLLKNLIELKEYWQNQNLLPGVLIAVHYIKVAAKSNRLQALLGDSSNTPNKSVVGAKFSQDDSPKHIITHYISHEILSESIERLTYTIDILNTKFNGEISHSTINDINKKKIRIKFPPRKKTIFFKVIVDAYYIEKFNLP